MRDLQDPEEIARLLEVPIDNNLEKSMTLGDLKKLTQEQKKRLLKGPERSLEEEIAQIAKDIPTERTYDASSAWEQERDFWKIINEVKRYEDRKTTIPKLAVSSSAIVPSGDKITVNFRGETIIIAKRTDSNKPEVDKASYTGLWLQKNVPPTIPIAEETKHESQTELLVPKNKRLLNI